MKIKILAFALILLGVLRSLYPDFVRLPNLQIDKFALSFILLGTSVVGIHFFAKQLKRIREDKNKWLLFKSRVWLYTDKFAKGIVVVFCLAIVFIRMFYKELYFDSMSLYLLIIIVLIVAIPDLKDLILRIKRFKAANVEFELIDAVKDLEKEVDDLEKEQPPLEKDKSQITAKDIKKELFTEYLMSLSNEPKSVIPIISAEIERRTRNLAIEAGVRTIFNNRDTVKKLNSLGVLSDEMVRLNNKFMKIRNLIVHGLDENLQSHEIIEAANLGLRILNFIPEKLSNEKRPV